MYLRPPEPACRAIAGSIGVSDGGNRFAYGRNNPYKYTDPSGKDFTASYDYDSDEFKVGNDTTYTIDLGDDVDSNYGYDGHVSDGNDSNEGNYSFEDGIAFTTASADIFYAGYKLLTYGIQRTNYSALVASVLADSFTAMIVAVPGDTPEVVECTTGLMTSGVGLGAAILSENPFSITVSSIGLANAYVDCVCEDSWTGMIETYGENAVIGGYPGP